MRSTQLHGMEPFSHSSSASLSSFIAPPSLFFNSSISVLLHFSLLHRTLATINCRRPSPRDDGDPRVELARYRAPPSPASPSHPNHRQGHVLIRRAWNMPICQANMPGQYARPMCQANVPGQYARPICQAKSWPHLATGPGKRGTTNGGATNQSVAPLIVALLIKAWHD